MSRSVRKVPIIGITCKESEHDDKRIAQRRLRRAAKEAMRRGRPLPLLREVSDIWNFAKDGKRWMNACWPWRDVPVAEKRRWMRK